MSIEEAEGIVMAAEVGMFHGTRGELAMALLIVKANQDQSAREAGR